ncbi:DNA-binding domain-containing protein [Massilia sp. DD77]|uniref:DNA-binding domain-containing protein n=1 Tax=Massilia sp. DD77 TaxID=3109349 RepID=UPI003000C598
MKLDALQRGFQRWLTGAAPEDAARLPGAGSAGLAVYQNNYRAQLVGCLQASYPRVRGHIGDDAFLHAAVRHIAAHPPHAWTLDAYADNFGATLEALFPDNPDVHELAWIEHALGAAFVAADAGPLAADGLAAIDWDTARLELAPALRLRSARTNAAEVWSALDEGASPVDSAMLPEAAGLLVWRSGFTACMRATDAIELAALDALRTHGSFAGVCDLLVERLGAADGTARAGVLLAGWIGAGLVASVRQASSVHPEE